MAKIYTVNEAAYVLGVSESTVRHWIREGKLKAMWVGNVGGGHLYLTKEEDIEECMLNQTQHSLEVINRYYSRKEKERYLEQLDAREQELYDELCVLEKIRHYCQGLEL